MASSKEHPLNIDETDHAVALMRNLDCMKQEEHGCDLTIKVGEEEIQVHRDVMSACSDYFKAMLSHDTAENQSGIVDMKGVEFRVVKKCVDYIYTGKIFISEDECEELFIVASLMQLNLLCGKIGSFLATLLNPTAFFKFLRWAVQFNCHRLKTACDTYALINLGAISREEEFYQMDLAYISFLMEAEDSPYSKDSRLRALLRWIKADAEQRRQHLVNLARLLDLEKISYQYGRYLAETEPLCYESPEFMRNIFIAVMNREKVESVEESKLPFHGERNALIIFNKTSKTLGAYHPANNKWSNICDMHEEMVESLGYTAVAVEKYLYVLMTTKKVFRLNVMERELEWVKMDDMLKEHGRHLRAAVNENFVYVAGENTMERFNTTENVWEIIDSEGITLYQCALVEYGGDIYTIGGTTNASGSSVTATVHKFAQSSGSWESVINIKYDRRLAAAVNREGKLYVAGGLCFQYNGTYGWNENKFRAEVEVYDEKASCWSSISSLSLSRAGFGLCVVGNDLFAVGGNSGTGDSIERYSFKRYMWEVVIKNCGAIMAPATLSVWLPQSNQSDI